MRTSRLLFGVGILLLQHVAALASQVVPMSLDVLADHSGQVIVGTVERVESHWEANPRRIETTVTLGSVTFLKGIPTTSTDSFDLTVPGGTVGEFQMRVCCAPEYNVGDKWVLMLLPTYKTYPVVGIYRGALKVKADGDGVERVYDASGRSVTGIDGEGHFVLDGQTQRSVAQHLVGSRNVHLKPADARHVDVTEAMPFSAFVNELAPILASSRQHAMTQSAGVRVPADLQPVSLKLSPTGRDAESNATTSVRELPKPRRAAVDPRKSSKEDAR